MIEPVDRPAPLEALAVGVSAIVRGPDLEEALGSLLAGAVAATGATSAMVALQDLDRPAPELTMTVGLDEAGQAAALAAVADASHPLTATGRDRSPARAGTTIALPLIAGRDGIEEPIPRTTPPMPRIGRSSPSSPTSLRWRSIDHGSAPRPRSDRNGSSASPTPTR